MTESVDHVPWPDLLHPEPRLAIDAAAVERALAFSFVAEDDGGVLASALAQLPVASSAFEPEFFAEDLFVAELVQRCMRPRIQGRELDLDWSHVLRLFCQPPRDPAVGAQRREVWRELAEQPEARKAVEQLYEALRALRKLFEGQARVAIRGEQARRRLEILEHLHHTLAHMTAPAFEGAGSALSRIAAYGAYVQASPAHARLAELLQYENERAFVDLTLQMGADGGVRGLSLVALRENTKSPYHVSLVRQWLDRLWLWVRGYRLTEGELVDRWLDHVFEGVRRFIPALLQLSHDLELYLAGLAFRDAALERSLSVCFAEEVSASEPGELEELFNPLLFFAGDQLVKRPIPCSLELGASGTITLLTGPNSGGKTRLLQALGIVHLCAQGGMFVPAKGARLHRVPGIFASLNQSALAEQPEGRLGTELMRIRQLFERAVPGCLTLIDELCSGTSPSEGEELFEMVLDLLDELGPEAFVSTHFLKYTAELAKAPRALHVRFLQVELDAEQRPTYRFVPGVAETSLAKQTASRLGVTRDELRALLALKRQ